MKKFNITVDSTKKFLQAFNGIFNMTSMELSVLAELMDHGDTVNLCSPDNKRKVSRLLEIKDHNTLNNYVKRLKDKKAIIKSKDGYVVNPVLRKQASQIIITIKNGGNATD